MNKSSDDTQVDLGQDLLEKTTTLHTEVPPSNLNSDQIADLLQSARILMAEKILDEAKKILRQIIRNDSQNLEALKLLEELQCLELNALIGEMTENRGNPGVKSILDDVNSEEVMKKLDLDLKLGIFFETQSSFVFSESGLFNNKESLEKFEKNLETELVSLSTKDHIDIGIAFLEMGLYEIAAKRFRVAKRDPLESLMATGLEAYAQILSGHSFEATLNLEPLLRDSEILAVDKIELLYLMGRAYEQLQKPELAKEWYMQAKAVDPLYRDIENRLRFLSKVNQ